MIPPRSSRTRSPLDPIHPSQFDTPPLLTTAVRLALWAVGFGVAGAWSMMTIPTGESGAVLHLVGAVVGLVGGAVFAAAANERHANDRRLERKRYPALHLLQFVHP